MVHSPSEMLYSTSQMNCTEVIPTVPIEAAILKAITSEALKTTIPSIVYTLLLLIVGLPGNLCVLYVYYFRWKKSNTRYFIFSMAVLDMTNCLVSLPTEIVFMFNMYRFDHNFICKAVRFTTYAMNGASALILLTIAIDRYMRICRPFSDRLETRAAFQMCVASIVVGILFDSPALYVYGTLTTPLSKFNRSIVLKTCLVDDNVKPEYACYFILWISLFFIFIASTITVLYSCIGSEIWKRRRFPTSVYSERPSCEIKRNSSFTNGSVSGIHRKSRPSVNLEGSRRWARHRPRVGKSAFCLFIITVVYYVSFLPFLTLAIVRCFNKDFYSSMDRTGLTFYHLFLRSYQLSSAINPIIYSFYNAQFRKQVCLLMNKILCRSQA